jgi:O-antigen ligase
MSSYALGAARTVEDWWKLPLALVGAAVVGVVAVIAPLLAIGLVLGIAFLVLTSRNLANGLAFFIALAFFDVMPGVGGGLTLVKGAGAVLALLWIASLMNRRRPVPFLVREQPLLAYAAVFLFAWALVSSLWAEASGTAFGGAFRLAQGIVLVFIVFTAVRTPRDLRLILGVYMAGAAATAIVGLAGGTAKDSVDVEGRYSGGIGDPNELAAFVVPALIVAAFSFWVARRGSPARLLLPLAGGLSALVLFMTESRGGIVSLVVAFVFGIVVGGPVRSRVVTLVLVVGALGLAYFTFVAPPESLKRVTTFADAGGTGRGDVWPIAISIAHDHPFAGVGWGNFTVVEPRYALGDIDLTRADLIVDRPHVAHNTYLHVLAETGIIGLAALLAIIGAAIAAAMRGIRALAARGEQALEIQARGLVVGTVGMLVGMSFISGQYEKHLWLLLGLLPTVATIGRRSAPAEPDYDLDVREQLVEQLEKRIVERMDALLLEQERLARRRAALAAREDQIRARLQELEGPAAVAPTAAPAASPAAGDASSAAFERQAAELERLQGEIATRLAALEAREAALADRASQVEARTAELDERESRLEERVRLITQRELSVARAAATAQAQAHAQAEAQAQAQAQPQAPTAAAPVAQPPLPPPVAQTPVAEPPAAPAEIGAWPLTELERVVAERGSEHPDLVDEWRYYLRYLRDFSNPDGTLPASFDALVDEVFAPLLDRA